MTLCEKDRVLLREDVQNGKVQKPDDGPWTPGFTATLYGTGPLGQSVDLQKANATVPSDKDYILGLVAELAKDTKGDLWASGRDSTARFANPSFGTAGLEMFNRVVR